MTTRVVLAVLAAASLAGCGGGGDEADKTTPTRPQTTQPKPITCPARLLRGGVEYRGSDVRLPAEVGRPLGRGTIPRCGKKRKRTIAIGQIQGVSPSVAVGEPEDAFTVWVAKSARPKQYPAALERILFGPTCSASRGFMLAGRFVGESRPGQPLSVQIDATDAFGVASAYRGAVIDLVVTDATKGLNSRDAFAQLEDLATIRARVRCVDADRPDRTFLAEQIVATKG